MLDPSKTVSPSLLKTWTDGAVRDPAILAPLKSTQGIITLRFSGIASWFGSQIAMAEKSHAVDL
jgi:hypothetical protein